MDEFEVIRRYFSTGFPARDDVSLGIGDDGAVTRLESGVELLTVTDALVAGTHFPASLPADAVAHRSLAANLSDLAAMGARPRWFTLALALPDTNAEWLDAFARGLRNLAARFEVALIGGDTVRGPLAVTITAMGTVPQGQALQRRGARDGDGIFVSGTLGDAGWAWQALADHEELTIDDPAYGRFAYPQPRVSEGRSLRGFASAAIDLSDGLQPDLERLLAASGVGGELQVADSPLSDALLERAGAERARELALVGGEDFELCFTMPGEREEELRAIAATWSCRLTRIGRVRAMPGLHLYLDGVQVSSPSAGFRHFESDG